jgi:hypothetical protein
MSWARSAAGAALFAASMGLTGCGGGASTPSSVTFTDLFTGTLLQGATDYGPGNRNHFTVHGVGSLSATITKLSPVSTITVGLGVGVFDTLTSTCSLQVSTDLAKVSVVLQASANGAFEGCVGVYDVGGVTDPVTYEVSVTHS